MACCNCTGACRLYGSCFGMATVETINPYAAPRPQIESSRFVPSGDIVFIDRKTGRVVGRIINTRPKTGVTT